jgi:hypothetical protein
VTSWALDHHLRVAKLSEGVASSSFGRSVKKLMESWDEDPFDESKSLPALRKVLEKGLLGGAMPSGTLLELTMRLFKKHGTHPSRLLTEWMEEDFEYIQRYMKIDPVFYHQFMELVRRAELERGSGGSGSMEKSEEGELDAHSSMDDSVTTSLLHSSVQSKVKDK